MGRLVNGEWVTNWVGADADGQFQRAETRYRSGVSDDAQSRFRPSLDRYHLYVGWACPWAHRTMMVRALMGLERALPVSVVEPFMGEGGWRFNPAVEGASADELLGCEYLREVYLRADPQYTGRVTVPILWDKQLGTIVNNESREIVRILDHGFAGMADHPVDLAPSELHGELDRLIDLIYEPVNNGVYRAGFAGSQRAYDDAVRELFETLDHCESILDTQRWLAGERATEVDLFLFATLIRFDLVYHTHFMCNRRRVVDYPNLWGFVRELYQVPAIAQTCKFDHICGHYYASHPSISPSRIIAIGPELQLDSPHGREARGGLPALELFTP